MLKKTLMGLFSNREDVDATIGDLKDQGFQSDAISVVAKDTIVEYAQKDSVGSKIVKDAGSGATTGAAAGGLIGLLVGIGAIVIPGIGGLLVAGPIAAALGLTGAAAMTVSGAVTGALAGGLLGAFMGLGFSESQAKTYETRMKAGDIMLAITLEGAPIDENVVESIFEKHHGQNLHTLHQSTT